MQSDKERFKVAAYYYDKAAEVGLDNAGRLVQFYTDVEGDWQDGINSSMMTGEVGFHPAYTWRIKPETVMHPGGEIPKPCLNASDFGDYVYVPDCKFDKSIGAVIPSCREVINTNIDKSYALAFVNAGIGHKTRGAAIAHAKVIYQIED